MLAMIDYPICWFLTGILSAVVAYIIWLRVRVSLESRSTLQNVEDLPEPELTDPLEHEAQEHIKACQKRLLMQAKLNPDWLQPLRDELPPLVQKIAKTFYPEAKNPLLEPGISEFVRATQLTAEDIATFLQTNLCGRVVDVSVNTAQRTYNAVKRLKYLKQTVKWYKRVRPLVQILKYKSVFMWTSLLGRNVAVRTLHSRIATIVGKRAIELYSGRLAKQAAE